MGSEVMIPPWVLPESPETIRWIDDATMVFAPAFGRGMTQRGSWGDPRWGLRRRYRGLSSDQKAAILACLNESRGQLNRILVTPHTPLRGSFPTSEFLTNPTFASGTTGWSAGADASLSSIDRRLRIRRAVVAGNANSYASQSITPVANVPYIGRVFIAGLAGENAVGCSLSSTVARTSIGSTSGIYSAVIVPPAASGTFFIENTTATGAMTNAFFDVNYTTLARVPLIDNGVNLLQWSDALDNAVWTKTATTVTADAFTSPMDGGSNADRLVETTANSGHVIEQAYTKGSNQMDIFVYAVVHSGTLGNARSRFRLEVYQNGGTDQAFAIFDTSSGTIISGPTAAGSTTNARAGIMAIGNGWYFCWVGGYATTNTTVSLVLRIVNAGTTISYTGSTTGDLGIARLGISDSPLITGRTNVVGRPVQTTGSVVSGTILQTGAGLYLKGLPISTDGLLKPGDWCEVAGQLKQTTAPLNSDAAGFGFWQFRPALGDSPADSEPVVIHQPFGRFIYSGQQKELQNMFGIYGDIEMDLEEAYT